MIAMENLARTAGYADPQRLTWAMEAEAIADLAQGSISVTNDDVIVKLSIDAKGEPQLDITKKGKTLKDIPGKLKKVPEIAEMRERKTDIGKQILRMRQSLEESMIRGDLFTTNELKDLFKHPVLKPMLESLVFMTEDGGHWLSERQWGLSQRHVVRNDARGNKSTPRPLLRFTQY